MFEKLTPVQRSLISAFTGFVGYGAWAFAVNQMHGWQAGVKAAGVQGSYSFAVTLIMTLLLESVYKRLFAYYAINKTDTQKNSASVRCSTQRIAKKPAIFTVVIVCLILYSSSWLINYLAGTPEIFNTVILGYIIGTVYTVLYTRELFRNSLRNLYLRD